MRYYLTTTHDGRKKYACINGLDGTVSRSPSRTLGYPFLTRHDAETFLPRATAYCGGEWAIEEYETRPEADKSGGAT